MKLNPSGKMNVKVSFQLNAAKEENRKLAKELD